MVRSYLTWGGEGGREILADVVIIIILTNSVTFDSTKIVIKGNFT